MINDQQPSVISTLFSKPFLAILLLFTVICLLNIPVLITLWRYGFDDGTYSHAFLIPFITLYLYFLLAESGRLQFRKKVSIAPTILLIASCYLLFVTSNAQISVGFWLSFLTVFITSVTMLYRFNWYIVFPAAFLIFIFPFWGGLIQPLQSLSIIAVSYMMSFTNIPVFVEATYVTVPAGVFEIAGGCSGLRYLLVSLAVSSMFIFLNINNRKNAVIFLIVAVLGALLTNWIRITLLIVIGEFTEMQSSLMADHNMFGWYLYIPFMIFLFKWGERLSLSEPINNDNNPLKDNYNKTNTTLSSITIAAIIVSSTLVKSLLSHSMDTSNNALQVVKQPSANIFFYSSIEEPHRDSLKNKAIYRVYSFDKSDLDSKATYFANQIIPKGWSVKSKVIEGQWQTHIISNGTKNAKLKVSYEIDNERIATLREFKIKRFIKGFYSTANSKLHWKFELCKVKCE